MSETIEYINPSFGVRDSLRFALDRVAARNRVPVASATEILLRVSHLPARAETQPYWARD